MSNTICLAGPPFSITGETQPADQNITFQFSFDTEADQAQVIRYEWYIDELLVNDNNTFNLAGALSCGAHSIGGRILTAGGWSDIKTLAITTCTAPTSVILDGPLSIKEGDTQKYSVIAHYANGTVNDVTNLYTLDCPAGTFDEVGELSIPTNNTGNDDRESLITATPSQTGYPTLKQTVHIIDTTQPLAVQIPGPTTVAKGTDNTYQVMATYAGNGTIDMTSHYVFSAAVGTFTGNVYHAPSGADTNDTITISKDGVVAGTLTITVRDSLIGIQLNGPTAINEGEAGTLTVTGIDLNGNTVNLTGLYAFTTTIGQLAYDAVNQVETLTIPENSTVGDSTNATVTAARSGYPSLQKAIQINDTTQIPGVLVIDFFTDASLNLIGYIDDESVDFNHEAAYTGQNFIPTSAIEEPADALILASDLATSPASSLRWRFEFNIAQLVSSYPANSGFTFYIKGRGSADGSVNGAMSLKTFGVKMKMNGSPGSYMPSTDNITQISSQNFTTHVSSGADNTFTEQYLLYVLQIHYDVQSKNVTLTPVSAPFP